MYGTLNIKRENQKTHTIHSVKSVRVVDQTQDSMDLDVEVYSTPHGDIDVIEILLEHGDKAFEMNAAAQTVNAYFATDKNFKG